MEWLGCTASTLLRCRRLCPGIGAVSRALSSHFTTDFDDSGSPQCTWWSVATQGSEGRRHQTDEARQSKMKSHSVFPMINGGASGPESCWKALRSCRDVANRQRHWAFAATPEVDRCVYHLINARGPRIRRHSGCSSRKYSRVSNGLCTGRRGAAEGMQQLRHQAPRKMNFALES